MFLFDAGISDGKSDMTVSTWSLMLRWEIEQGGTDVLSNSVVRSGQLTSSKPHTGSTDIVVLVFRLIIACNVLIDIFFDTW